MSQNKLLFPTQGRPKDEVLAAMQSARQDDVHWREGKAFSLVFAAGDQVSELLKEAYTLFFSENGLNPMAFPSLRKFEAEVVAMCIDLLGGGEQAAGNMTTGGTESLLVTVLTAREWARANRPEIRFPEMVLPATAHPAFDKAAHYFGVKAIRVPVRADFRADVEACRAAITSQTVLMVGSAPSYPQGVIDPIPELAQIAQERKLLFHVDACVGGLMLPFVRRLGYPVPGFDFQVPGVTSISADLHKYGYSAKGSSVILYRTHELRRHQFFVTTDWSGGVYASPTMAGTRPGGPIAASWAILNYLGEEGYLKIADTVMKTTTSLRQGVTAIRGLKVLSTPEMSVFAIASDELNVYEIADEMTLRGWHMDRQQFPPSLHVTVNYGHAGSVDAFLQDLAAAAAEVRRPSLRKMGNALFLNLAKTMVKLLPKETVSKLTASASSALGDTASGGAQRSAAMYGMIGTLPNRGDLHEVVLDLIDGMTRIPEAPADAQGKSA